MVTYFTSSLRRPDLGGQRDIAPRGSRGAAIGKRVRRVLDGQDVPVIQGDENSRRGVT